MIWQEHPSTVVMVTNLKEENKSKCHQYWPEKGSEKYGPFIITNMEEQVYTDYIIRLLQVEVSDKCELY